MSEQRKGVLFAVAAYTIWGLLPLFWRLLRPASAVEILCHRIAWSLAVTALLVARSRNLDWLRAIGGRRLRLLGLASAALGVNWLTFIWAVRHERVVETSLGYFINPLVSVLLGVVFLGERLRRAQWATLGIATAAVLVLTIDYGRLPWVALSIAFSFALYGLAKKRAGVGPRESLTVELGLLFLPALVYLLLLDRRGEGTFGHLSLAKDCLLAASGLVTAIPFLWFAAATNRVPLTMIGLLQCITPSLQFFCGAVVMHEAMPPSRMIAFTLLWIGLAVYAVESILYGRREASRILPTRPVRVEHRVIRERPPIGDVVSCEAQ